jgi:hypothetical protein
MMDEKSKMESEFIQLILGLESSGWMTLGKIANPMTGQLETSLEAAKGIIDTLIMLKDKTKENLSKTEVNVLIGALQNLQVNYVEEVNKPQPEKEECSEEPKNDDSKAETPKQEKKSRIITKL